MSELENLIHNSNTGLFEVGLSDEYWNNDSRKMKNELTSPVLDKKTLDLIEVPELFNAIDYTRSGIGKRILWRSLIQPPTSLELIKAKQESALEIERNSQLENQLTHYILSLGGKEHSLIGLFYGDKPYSETEYDRYKGAKAYFERMVDGIRNIEVETAYLKTLFNDVDELSKTRTYDFIKGPVFSTWKGLKPGSEVGFFTPKVKFTCRHFKPTLVTLALAQFPLAVHFFNTMGGEALAAGLLFDGMFSMFAAMSIPPGFDQNCFIDPLRDMYKADENVWKGIEAAGKIDELLSFVKYSKTLKDNYTMPTVTDRNPHYFLAENLMNPILMDAKPKSQKSSGCGGCKGNAPSDDNEPDIPTQFCIPNDVELNGQYLTMITGPNDGGKTTYSKTIAQIQLLAQIGCYIPAKKAEISVADQIHYSAAIVGKLAQRAGDYKLEMIRLRDILFNSTPRSLVILNDAITGTTTHKEGIVEYYNALDGFYAKRNNTVLVTHNLELVKKLHGEEKGKCLQVEFKEGNPTHRIIPGISEYSHASAVSKKIGMSREDIQSHLRNKGYLK